MADNNHIASASVVVNAPPASVWRALTDPETIAKYMFGSAVTSDWTVGSTITYAGEYEGKKYEDHGTILEIIPNELLRSTHFSPLSGKPDVPENYHTLEYTLAPDGGDKTDTDNTGGARTKVTLTQDNNASKDEADHSAANWNQMLEGLKRVVEAEEVPRP